MSSSLLTSKQVSELLGVGVSSINRWADAGRLEHVKTPGGHRRFERAAVEAFQRERAGIPADGPDLWLNRWVEQLLSKSRSGAVQAALLEERAKSESWLSVAESFGAVLARIGELWATGEISVTEEHLASERLARGLSRCAEAIPVAETAPLALLAAPESEEHTLGLSLLEAALREWGWRCRWAGRRTPLLDLSAEVRNGDYGLVALTASVSTPAVVLREVANVMGEAASTGGATLLLGGRGPWPEDLEAGIRIERFAELASEHAQLRRR